MWNTAGNFLRALPTNTTEVNQCTIFELIMVDISQHALIEISYVYVILCFSCTNFLVPDIKKCHNNFNRATIFGSTTSHCKNPTPSLSQVALTQQVSDRALTSLNVQAQGKYAAVGDAGGRDPVGGLG